MKRPQVTPRQIQAALRMYEASAPARVSDAWLIYWPEIEPTVCRYQWPVTLAHVLGEHHAAVSAEPLPSFNSTPNDARTVVRHQSNEDQHG